jgi:VanZ family protein
LNAKFSRYSLTLSITAVVIGVPLLFIPWNDTYEPRSLKEIWNFGHFLLFAFATVLLTAYWQWFRDRIFEEQIIILVILGLLVGMAIEIIQLHTGGDFSLHDVYLDVTGACLVPAISPQCRYRPAQYRLWILRLVVILYLVFRAYPVAISLVDEYQARRDFPVLAGFQSKLELGRFSGGSRLKLTDEGLQVDFSTKQYSGFSLKYFPGDWSGYHMLNIDIRNPGNESVYLTCRIHDEHHNQAYGDRYNRRFIITPGDQTIKIDLEQVRSAPSARTMDMKKIGGLGCFTVSLVAPVQLIIRKIYLK